MRFVIAIIDIVSAFGAGLETFFTVVAGTCIALLHVMLMVMLGSVVYDAFAHAGEAHPIPMIVAGIIAVAMDGPFGFMTWKGLSERRDQPLAIHVAYAFPLFPKFLRPFPFLWWLSHFAMGAFLAYMAHVAPLAARRGTLPEMIRNWTIAILVALGLCSTANVYLISAVAALTRRAAILEAIWRRRMLVDLAMALAVCMIPFSTHSDQDEMLQRMRRDSQRQHHATTRPASAAHIDGSTACGAPARDA